MTPSAENDERREEPEARNMFERIIGIDWSGAGDEFGVAEWHSEHGSVRLKHAPEGTSLKWKRNSIYKFLKDVLRPSDSRTLLMIDAGFGYPKDSRDIIFSEHNGENGKVALKDLVDKIRCEWQKAEAAIIDANDKKQKVDSGDHYRRVAHQINDKVGEPVPFLLGVDPNSSSSFFIQKQVPCLRCVEQLIVAAKSQYDLRPGPIVGGHTLSWLAALSDLIGLRDENKAVHFIVWPHEEHEINEDHLEKDKDKPRHIVAEGYPTLFADQDKYYDFEVEEGEIDFERLKSDLENWNDAKQTPKWLKKLTPAQQRNLQELLNQEEKVTLVGQINELLATVNLLYDKDRELLGFNHLDDNENEDLESLSSQIESSPLFKRAKLTVAMKNIINKARERDLERARKGEWTDFKNKGIAGAVNKKEKGKVKFKSVRILDKAEELYREVLEIVKKKPQTWLTKTGFFKELERRKKAILDEERMDAEDEDIIEELKRALKTALNRAMLEKNKEVKKWLLVKKFDENKRDAFRMVHWAKKKMAEGSIESEFDLPSAVCDCEETLKQVKEEGWILGLE